MVSESIGILCFSLLLPSTSILGWVWSLCIFSGPSPKESFPIRDDYVNGVTFEDLKLIDWSKAYGERRNFENLILEQAKKIQASLIPQIVELDHNSTMPTF